MGNGAIFLGGLIFALMAFLHLARVFCPFTVMIGTFVIPHWFSYVGFIIFGLLSIYQFKACNYHHLPPPPPPKA